MHGVWGIDWLFFFDAVGLTDWERHFGEMDGFWEGGKEGRKEGRGKARVWGFGAEPNRSANGRGILFLTLRYNPGTRIQN